MLKSKENPILNLGFNILIPVILLKKGSEWSSFSPLLILLISLAFPFCYGLKDFITMKKINFISVIGLLNIALTGGFALFQLKGIYFVIKEASLPLFLALICVFSVFIFKKPVMEWIILKSSLFNHEILQEKLNLNNNQVAFKKLMNKSTLLLSLSFVLSAILNFIVALSVFLDIDSNLTKEAQTHILNEQVANMTWLGYIFIAIPLSIFTLILMVWIFKKLKLLTNLSLEDLLLKEKQKGKS
ncbi:MAG: hypothetical protein GDA46_02995 [Bdellovibrionales bacterium]|nr:hypothetical protein [Bdellovibrionales bacterium]